MNTQNRRINRFLATMILCSAVVYSVSEAGLSIATDTRTFDSVLAVAQFQSLGSGSEQTLLADISRTFVINEMKLIFEPNGIKVVDIAGTSQSAKSHTPMPPSFGSSAPRTIPTQTPAYDYVLDISYSGDRGTVYANPSVRITATNEMVKLPQFVFSSDDILGSSRRAAASIASSPVFGISGARSRVLVYRCFGLDDEVSKRLSGSVSNYELIIEMPRDLAESAASLSGPDVVAREDKKFQKSRNSCGRDYWRPDTAAKDLDDDSYVLSGRYSVGRSGFVAEVMLYAVASGQIEVLQAGPEKDIEQLFIQMKRTLPSSISRVLREEGNSR